MKKVLPLLIACMLVTSSGTTTKPKEINVWNKVSTDDINPGEILSLDMSKGYSFCEGDMLFIIVRAIGYEEEVIIAFPNGGYWNTPEPDPFLQALQKEFDSLEDYLRNLESKEIKKK